jgi:hypothetical protein
MREWKLLLTHLAMDFNLSIDKTKVSVRERLVVVTRNTLRKLRLVVELEGSKMNVATKRFVMGTP